MFLALLLLQFNQTDLIALSHDGLADTKPRPVAFQQSEPEQAIPALPTVEDTKIAHGIMQQWVQAYHEGRFIDQWDLTDPRIRRWHPKRRWRKWMTRATKRNGKIKSYEVTSITRLYATQLPCTEQGHCYRKDVPVILFMIKSEYEKAGPPQPEYIVMSKSEEGWKFGGGTFPNRPMGETSLILDRKDEKRYTRPRFD
jgi:hypothetical protein